MMYLMMQFFLKRNFIKEGFFEIHCLLIYLQRDGIANFKKISQLFSREDSRK
jgi:hypothetical protein